MDTAVAIVSFGSGGMIEVRAEPPQHMLLEVRSQTGTARTPTHEWHPGRGGVRLIRYQRGEAVEQRPLLPGQVQRVVTGRTGESLRLQGVSDDGTPRVLDFRVVSAAHQTGAHGAISSTTVSPAASIEQVDASRAPSDGLNAFAPPAVDVSAVVSALDARLYPQLSGLSARLEALESRLAAPPAVDPQLGRQLELLAHRVQSLSAPAVDLAPVLARLDALARGQQAGAAAPPVDLGPVLDRLDALDVRVASAALDEGPDLSALMPRIEAFDHRLVEIAAAQSALGLALNDTARVQALLAGFEARLTEAVGAARTDPAPMVDGFGALRTELAALKPELAALKPELAALKPELAALKPDPAAFKTDLGPLEARLDGLLAQLAPLAQGMDKALESRLIPVLAAFDRADRDRALAQERSHAIVDRLVGLEARLDDDGGLGGRVAATHERITRLATQLSEVLAGGERLDALADHLTRIERMLLAAPSLDGRLTAIQAQIGRIEEGAGSITPELIELIAGKLETLDPRAGMADLDARVFGFSRRLDEITAQLQAGLGADSPLGARLTATLGTLQAEQARLAADLATLAPALAEGLTPLAAEATARTRAQAAMAEALAEATTELRALNEREDPAPSLAEVRGRLDALADAEHTAQSLDRLRAGLDALAARPAPPPPPDHTDALLRIDEQVGRLERHIRSDGKQVDKAIAAAMAAVRSFSDDGQLELIEERLSLMEKRTGGIDPRVVEQLESAARKLKDAGPGADLTPVLDRLDELGRRVTQMPPMQPPVMELGDLEGKLDALGAQVAAWIQAGAAHPRQVAGPSPELLALGEQVERLTQRIEALADRPAGSETAPSAGFDLQSIEVRLDALADLLAGPARRGDDLDLDDSAELSALEAQLNALDAGLLPGEPAGTSGAVGALGAQLMALTTRLDGLSDRLAAEPVAEQAVTPALSALESKLDALAERLEGLGQEGLEARQAVEARDGLGVLAMKIDALAHRVEDGAMARSDDTDVSAIFGLVERLGSRVDALADRVDVLAARLSTPPGHGLPLAGPEVDVPLDAAEESIDISSFPPSDLVVDGDGLEADGIEADGFAVDGPAAMHSAGPPPAVAPARPEPVRRSSDGAMLDGIDQLIDVIQTRQFDQQSVRGLLAQPRLDSLRVRLSGVREHFAGRLPGSTTRLIDQLMERIDDAHLDPLNAAQTALAEGNFAQAIQRVARALQSEGQAPLNTENVERTVLGIAKAVWDADPGLAAREGPARSALEELLAEMELALILPSLNTSWQPKDQRVQGRRPGQPGEPLNLVLEVHAPGFRRGDVVVDKAAVTISD